MKGIIATRFSDPKQVGGTSTETQIEVCERYCRESGIEIVGYYKVEAESAKSSNVARIAELLNECRKYQGKADVLIIFKVDRFARDVSQHYYLKTELIKAGISLRSATEPIDDTPQGELMETILAGFAQFDNSIKKERVKLAMWTRVDQGLWPWIPPIGYKPSHIEGVKLSPHIEDETCSWAVKEVFGRYSSGLVRIVELANEMTKQGIKNYKGTTLKFSKETIDRMLKNSYYIGCMKNKDGKLIKGKHKGIIEASLFEKCQEAKLRLSNNACKKRLRLNPDFPLRRYVTCGYCGKPLTACWAKSGKYPYYYCVNKKCSNFSISIKKTDIENQFVDYLRLVKPTDKTVKRFNRVFIKRYEERKKEIQGDYLRQLYEIKSLTEEEDWIVKRGKKGILPDTIVKKEIDDLEKKITIAKLQLNETHIDELDVNALLAYAGNFIRTIEMAWFDAPFEIKLRLQRLIFPKGVIYQDGVFSNSEISLLFGLINDFSAQKSSNVTPPGIEPEFSG